MKVNISIVIIHYNSVIDLKKCLDRLYPDLRRFPITVVDNNSRGSLAEIRKKFPEVSWIKNQTNVGFSKAANQGVVATKSRWILFLNPDVLISGTEIEALFHFAEKNHLDAVSPDFEDERYRKPVPTLETLLSEFTPLHVVKHSLAVQRTLVGGCLLIRRNVLEELGGWDERFFLWFEDSDLTKRLIQAGYKVGFSATTVQHHGAGSIAQLKPYIRRQIFFQSMDIYARKHLPIWQQVILQKSIIYRFSDRRGYPILHKGASFVVPNMKQELIIDFLSTNLHFFRNTQLIVVTSALNCKQLWKVRAAYPHVRFIRIERNHGFAHTVNIGFRVSTTEYVGTVNDDVIVNDQSVEHLIGVMSNEIGSLNPLIFDLSDQLESAGVRVELKGKAIPITTLPKQRMTVVPATNAAFVLYNAEALEKVGLFDEKFGSYLEDIDLSLRLRRFGYLNEVCKHVRVIHAKHSSSKTLGTFKYFLDAKNWWLVILKNWTLSDLTLQSPSILIERLRNLAGIFKQR